jgi:hypothetical protein
MILNKIWSRSFLLIHIVLINFNFLCRSSIQSERDRRNSSSGKSDYFQYIAAGGILAAAALAGWAGNKIFNNLFKSENCKRTRHSTRNDANYASVGFKVVLPKTGKHILLANDVKFKYFDIKLLNVGNEEVFDVLADLIKRDDTCIVSPVKHYLIDANDKSKRWIDDLDPDKSMKTRLNDFFNAKKQIISKDFLQHENKGSDSQIKVQISLKYLDKTNDYKSIAMSETQKKVSVYELSTVYKNVTYADESETNFIEALYIGLECRFDISSNVADEKQTKGFVLLIPEALFNKSFKDKFSGGYILERLFMLEDQKRVIIRKSNEFIYDEIEKKLQR